MSIKVFPTENLVQGRVDQLNKRSKFTYQVQRLSGGGYVVIRKGGFVVQSR